MNRSKRPSLAETMQRVARPEPPPALTSAPPPAVGEPASERAGGFYAATRAGKKKLTTAISEGAHKQFRLLAVERGQKGEALLIEAINDLFGKYGKPPIA